MKGEGLVNKGSNTGLLYEIANFRDVE